MDITPLQKYPAYRWLFVGQTMSYMGSMMSYVAIPYHVYNLTHDSAKVGLVSLVQVLPVLVFGLLGGALADRVNRRSLMLWAETGMCIAVAWLAFNASSAHPSFACVLITSLMVQSLHACHRPAMDALTQTLVSKEHFASVGALGTFRTSLGAILGPTCAGFFIAWGGVETVFWIDAFSFACAAYCAYRITTHTAVQPQGSYVQMLLEGARYAFSKPELIGTYLVDIIAMTFAFPTALFPAMSQAYGGAKAAGMLFSAMSVGALVITVFSGWVRHVQRRGAMVIAAAFFWGLFVALLGFSHTLWMSLLLLALAGAADMVSALFRGVIWNETVSNHMRGRLAGIEMISYMSGPLLGNARAGWMAETMNLPLSLGLGGLLCMVFVALSAWFLKGFWTYQSTPHPH
jgi:MFS family permease